MYKFLNLKRKSKKSFCKNLKTWNQPDGLQCSQIFGCDSKRILKYTNRRYKYKKRKCTNRRYKYNKRKYTNQIYENIRKENIQINDIYKYKIQTEEEKNWEIWNIETERGLWSIENWYLILFLQKLKRIIKMEFWSKIEI